MTNEYSKIDFGPFDQLEESIYQPKPNFKIEGKRFVKQELGLTSTEISLNKMKPQTSISFLHKHKENEEIYIGIKGEGQLLLNGTYINIKEGTVVRVATHTERAIRNHKIDGAFVFIVIQAKENSFKGHTTSDGYAIEKKPNWT